MNKAVLFKRWIKGLGHSRGFGVQSPFAYHFVVNVVCEKSHYYGYSDIEKKHPSQSVSVRKLGRLLLRLANYGQPSKVYLSSTLSNIDIFRDYLVAGSRKLSFVEKPITADMIVLSNQDNYILNDVEKKQADNTLLFVADIYSDKSSKKFWESLVDSQNISVSFDVFRAGIAFFSKQYHKRNYLINY